MKGRGGEWLKARDEQQSVVKIFLARASPGASLPGP